MPRATGPFCIPEEGATYVHQLGRDRHFRVRQARLCILASLHFEARMSTEYGKCQLTTWNRVSALPAVMVVIIIASLLSPREAAGYRAEPPWRRTIICLRSSHPLAHGHATGQASL